jgi:hypothetical protein
MARDACDANFDFELVDHRKRYRPFSRCNPQMRGWNSGVVASGLRVKCSARKNVWFHCNEEVLTMRSVLLTVFCTLCLIATAGVASAQENQTPENKDKNAAEKAADKAGDVKDKTVKGVKKTGKKTKEVAGKAGDKADDIKDKTVDTTKKGVNEVGDKAEDVKDKSVDTTKKAANEVGDKAEDVKDKTATGVKAATKGAKAIGSETADKAGDVKDKTAKGAKKSGNWLTRTFKKIF